MMKEEYKTKTIIENIYNGHTAKARKMKEKDKDKLILITVIFLSFFGLVFGVARMRGIIYGPVKSLFALKDLLPESITQSDENLNIASLLNIDNAAADTDGDGLSDSDELNTYHTSPYLEDSDSDGASDFDEIQRGSNPNCNEQRGNCSTQSTSGVQPPETPVAQGETLASNPMNMTAPRLRALLEKSNIDTSLLNSISDEELLTTYKSVILESQSGSAISGLNPQPQSVSSPSPSPERVQQKTPDLQKMPPVEIRNFLKKSGMTDEMLSKFNDQELLDTLKQTMEEQKP